MNPKSELPITEAHALMGHYARMLLDMQKLRIAIGNRIEGAERENLPAKHLMPLREQATAVEKAEKAIDAKLEQLAKRHFMKDVILETPGISLRGFARLLGITGPLSKFPTVSKLWKYLGMAVVDGHAPKRTKGVPFIKQADAPDGVGTAYSPQGRVLCHQIGDAIVKLNRGPYRECYDRKKAEYQTREGWTPMHCHNAAMRYAVKMMLKDLWIEWHQRESGQDTLDTQGVYAA